VLAVGQLSSLLIADPTPPGFIRFAALFVPVWWAWVIYVTYADRFDTDDASYRVIVLLGMLAVLAMAISLPRAFTDNEAAPFAFAYVLVRLVPLGLYIHAGRSLQIGRDLAWAYGTATVPAATLWLLGLLVPTPARFAVWFVAGSIEVLNPLIRRSIVARTPVAVSHLSERFGLFAIIVLGEAVLSVGGTLASGEWRTATALVGGAAFVIIAAQWWLYFDFIDDRPLRRGFVTRQIFVYGHLPIVLGITALAAGTRLTIGDVAADQMQLASGAIWALCGGAAVFELATAAIHASRHSIRDGLVLERAGVAVVLLVLGALGGVLAPLVLVASIAAVHIIQLGAELSWHSNEGVTFE
jgi:low temperature requirement protein LtrA